tara:strand:+ start:8692 stop:10101 length:1410 start_codon:yes stop_codon:yes gene_type:complete
MTTDIILIISLHGEFKYTYNMPFFDEDEDEIFENFLVRKNKYKPFTKINAVTPGVCNYLHDKSIYDFINVLKNNSNFDKLKYYSDENTNEVINSLKYIDPSLQLKTLSSNKIGVAEDEDVSRYRERLDQGWTHFRIESIKNIQGSDGETINCRRNEICKYIEKRYIYVPGETLKKKQKYDVEYLDYFLGYFNEMFSNIPEGTFDLNIENDMNNFSNLLAEHFESEENTLLSTKWEGGGNGFSKQTISEENIAKERDIEQEEHTDEEEYNDEHEEQSEAVENDEQENISDEDKENIDLWLKNLYIYKLLTKPLQQLLDTFPYEIKSNILHESLQLPLEKQIFSGMGKPEWDGNYRDNSIIILQKNGNEVTETDVTNDIVKSSGNRAILYRKEKKNVSSQRIFYFSDILKYLNDKYGHTPGNVTIVDLACNYIQGVSERTINTLRRKGRQKMFGYGKTKRKKCLSRKKYSQ